jgi:hypothetical protein
MAVVGRDVVACREVLLKIVIVGRREMACQVLLLQMVLVGRVVACQEGQMVNAQSLEDHQNLEGDQVDHYQILEEDHCQSLAEVHSRDAIAGKLPPNTIK